MNKGTVKLVRGMIISLILFLGLAATAPPGQAALSAEGATPTVTLGDFAWLTGHWKGEPRRLEVREEGDPGGLLAEQTWSEPRAGVMMGMFRLVEGEKTLVLEFFTLRETPEGIEMRLRHFGPALDPWEEDDALLLKLTDYDDTQAVFENPVHNQPKRSFILRTGEDTFTGRSEIIRDTGDTRIIEVAWRRAEAESGGEPAALSGENTHSGWQRMIRKEVTVSAPLAEVWKAWTTSEGATSFFAPAARIEAVLGGPYELYFDPSQPAGLRGSEGCKVHSLVPMKRLVFEWNAPPSIPLIRNSGLHTLVSLRFEELGPNQVRVELTHTGWGVGEEWDKTYAYFDRAWEYVLGNLRKRFAEGPLDWEKLFAERESKSTSKD